MEYFTIRTVTESDEAGFFVSRMRNSNGQDVITVKRENTLLLTLDYGVEKNKEMALSLASLLTKIANNTAVEPE
jgi:hypothetical protein